jgi:hypothetical protein
MLPHLMRPTHFQMAKQQSQLVKCTREPVSGGLMQAQQSRLMQVLQSRLHYFDIAVLSSSEKLVSCPWTIWQMTAEGFHLKIFQTRRQSGR